MMTNEEAIERLEYDEKKNKVVGQMDEYWEAFDLAISSLKSDDKYKWHDLRKNPQDLPESEVDVLVYDGDYGVCSYMEFWEEWYTTDDRILKDSIVAWRYIEPFEEEEDHE